MTTWMRRAASWSAVACLMPILVMGWPAKAMSQATAPARQLGGDRFAVAAGRTMEVAAVDSNEVLVTIEGGKYPLTAHGTADAAQRWAARTDSLVRAARASDRNEFGHFSDILRYQHFEGPGGRRDVVAIDIGPQNVPVFEASVSAALLDRLNGAMRRAATAARSLPQRSGARFPAESRGAVATLTSPRRDAKQSSNSTLSASEQCIVQSGLPPMQYTGPEGYAPGTSLDKLIDPPTRAGSPLPSYPIGAAGARVTGRVVARFVIDTAGRALIPTFRLVGVSNPLFVESVCHALPTMRFIPSAVKGRRVAQVVEKTFVIPPVPESR